MMKNSAAIITVLILSLFMHDSVLGFVPKNPDSVKKYTIKIIREIPHNRDSFTQGLLFYKGKLYESTGLKGKSTLQKVDAGTGKVEKIKRVPGVFAEGLARWNKHLVQLTWKDGVAFIYDIKDFSKICEFFYTNEGWGLTADSRYLIMSDGSDKLYFRDPVSFTVERIVNVKYHGNPLNLINELEYAGGYVYANIWFKNFLVQIDPLDGNVTGYVDCESLFHRLPSMGPESVFNGIAYNGKSQTFYLTGKNWPRIFEVILVPELACE